MARPGLKSKGILLAAVILAGGIWFFGSSNNQPAPESSKTEPLVSENKAETPQIPIPKPKPTPVRATFIPSKPAINLQPKQSNSCDPNYSGCVPIAYDVDCAGDSGRAPAYIKEQVTVVAKDKYNLDPDGNGIACD